MSRFCDHPTHRLTTPRRLALPPAPRNPAGFAAAIGLAVAVALAAWGCREVAKGLVKGAALVIPAPVAVDCAETPDPGECWASGVVLHILPPAPPRRCVNTNGLYCI